MTGGTRVGSIQADRGKTVKLAGDSGDIRVYGGVVDNASLRTWIGG